MSAGAGHGGRLPLRRSIAVQAGMLGAAAQNRKILDTLIAPEQTGAAPADPWTIAKERFRANRIAVVATFILAGIILLVSLTPVFEQHWAGRTHADQNLSGVMGDGDDAVEIVSLRGVPQVGPGFRREYTMGADPLGRDVFMRVLEGGRVSLTVGFAAAIITTIFAVLLGTAAGYYGGRVDIVISRYFEIQWAFPAMLLAISLSAALAVSGGIGFIQRGSILLNVLIIGFVSIPYLGRMIRSQVLSLSKREFVEASRSLGATSWRTMMREVIPNTLPMVITYFGLLASLAILFEASLSFLGVGVLPPTPSWGNIIADGRIYYSTAWWIVLFPGLFVTATVVCLNLIGEALEEAFDPKGSGGR